jgi:myo-inositol-1(or 4)-monophosphatase
VSGHGSVDPSALVATAVAIAGEAGALLAGFAEQRSDGADLEVSTKTSTTDPVSEADRAAERLIAQRLLERRPDDGLLAEEDQAARRGTTGLRWVVDPLDGTVNFLYGIPQWCVSVACEDEAGALVAVVRDPNRDETFQAVRGGGALLDGRPLAVTQVTTLAEALVATGFAYDPAVRIDQGRVLATLLGDVRDVRRAGSAALDLAWMAAGRFDAYVEFGLAPWDWAAGRLLVTEAGGRATDRTATLGRRRLAGLVASGPAVHDALLARVDGVVRP